MDSLLIRLYSDPRMETVWRATTVNRTPKRPNFPMMLYFNLSAWISRHTPDKPLSEYKQQYRRITDLARKLGAATHDTLLCDKYSALTNEIEELAKQAEAIESSIDTLFSCRSEPFPRIDKVGNHKKALVVRMLYRNFMNEFGTPLWKSIATIAEVALDLEADTVTVDFARGTCKGIAMRSSHRTCT